MSMAIKGQSGGWCRFEDYCNRGPKGSPFLYTSSILCIDDVVRSFELGERAANMWLEKDVDGWDPIFDFMLKFQT